MLHFLAFYTLLSLRHLLWNKYNILATLLLQTTEHWTLLLHKIYALRTSVVKAAKCILRYCSYCLCYSKLHCAILGVLVQCFLNIEKASVVFIFTSWLKIWAEREAKYWLIFDVKNLRSLYFPDFNDIYLRNLRRKMVS